VEQVADAATPLDSNKNKTDKKIERCECKQMNVHEFYEREISIKSTVMKQILSDSLIKE